MKFKACVLLAVAASAAPSPTLLYSGLGYGHGLYGLGYGYGGLGYGYGLSAVAAPLLSVTGVVPSVGVVPSLRATPVASQGGLSMDADPSVQIRLGGEGDPTVTVTINGEVCQNIKIPDVPQPSYGEPGRTGSYVTSWGQSAMVCGGYTGSSPPFSQYKDCQILDLDTKTWREGPKLVNFTASRESKKFGDIFYIFGGSYPANPGPGPTVWREHDIIQALDLNNLEEGWRVVEDVQKEGATKGSTTVAVDSTFFTSC